MSGRIGAMSVDAYRVRESAESDSSRRRRGQIGPFDVDGPCHGPCDCTAGANCPFAHVCAKCEDTHTYEECPHWNS